MTTTIYYHADCLDGFGAAYAAWRKFGATARYVPMHHGEPWDLKDIAGHDVYILDFSFPRDVLLDMANQAKSVTQLDHHVTARSPWITELIAHDIGAEYFQHPSLPLQLHFDMVRSGAHLAWQYFHSTVQLPRLLAHVEDIDLWRFALPDTRAFCRALRLLPFDFQAWDEIVQDEDHPQTPIYQRLLAEGKAIEQFFCLETQRLADSRLLTPITLKGEAIDPLQAVRHGIALIEEDSRAWRAISGIAINASSLFASELGNVLAERHGSFALIWEMNDQQIAKASLRACGKVNVAQIAENYGGGGHPNAAGFRLPMADFLPLLGRK